MLLEDRRSEEPKQDSFLLAALFNKAPLPIPGRIIKFTRENSSDKMWADKPQIEAEVNKDR